MLSNEEFLERLSNIHQNIVCLEEYQGMNNPIKFYCKICNKPLKKRKTPASILNQDIGCQRCARKLAGIKNSKSVMCIETGIIYNSIQEASEDTGINTGTISKLCRNISNTKFDIHFKYV